MGWLAGGNKSYGNARSTDYYSWGAPKTICTAHTINKQLFALEAHPQVCFLLPQQSTLYYNEQKDGLSRQKGNLVSL
eukprot:scaffold16674_cov24-Prasinocladus_malaysianus.AAC.1